MWISPAWKRRSAVDRVPGGGYLWSADVVGGDGGSGSFLIEQGQVLGEVRLGGAIFKIEPVAGTLHRITEIDPREIPGDIVVPAHWNSGDSWRGNWLGTVTSGPGALGTARMYGGSGIFRSVEAEAIETLSAKAYSAEYGPVAIDGQLTVEIPELAVDADPAD